MKERISNEGKGTIKTLNRDVVQVLTKGTYNP